MGDRIATTKHRIVEFRGGNRAAEHDGVHNQRCFIGLFVRAHDGHLVKVFTCNGNCLVFLYYCC